MESYAKIASRIPADTIGAIASTLCAIHCALFPLLVSLPSLLGKWFTEPVEIIFVSIAVSVAFFSAFRSFQRVGFTKISLFFVIGIALLLADVLSSSEHHYLSILGGIVLVFTHIANARAHASCSISPPKV